MPADPPVTDEQDPYAAFADVDWSISPAPGDFEVVYPDVEPNGANKSVLATAVDRHRKVTQDVLLSTLRDRGSPGSRSRSIAKLTSRLAQIAHLGNLVARVARPETILGGFDKLFPGHPFKLEDILIGRIADGDHTQSDVLSLATMAYPTSSDIDELIDHSLLHVFADAGALGMSPHTVVRVRLHELNVQGVLEPSSEVRETLRNIALGTLYKDNWNGHIEVLGLDSQLSKLFRRRRYFDRYTFPVSSLLIKNFNSGVDLLSTTSSEKCRKVIFSGLIVRTLQTFLEHQKGFPEVEGLLRRDSSIRILKFNNGRKSILVSNVFVVPINNNQFLLFNIGSDEVVLLDASERNSPQTNQVMKQVVIKNSPLAERRYLMSRPDMEYLFWNQKLVTFGWLKPYRAPGELYFSDGAVDIYGCAEVLARTEIETLKEDRDYLFTTERDVFWHSVVKGTQTALNTFQQALLLPAGGWVPHVIGLSLGAVNLAIIASKRGDSLDAEEEKQYDAEMRNQVFDCILQAVQWKLGSKSTQSISRSFSRFDDKPGTKANGNLKVDTPDNALGPNAARPGTLQRGLSDAVPTIERNFRLDHFQGTVIVKEICRTQFSGRDVDFKVVQRFGTATHRYESGYIDFDTFALHGSRRVGEVFENNWSRTLLVTAHGRHVFPPTLNTPKFAVPDDVTLEFYAPFGFSLRDPGLRSSVLLNPVHRPAVSLTNHFPHVAVHRPHAHAVRVVGGDFWDGTGMYRQSFDASGRLVLHDLKLSPYPRDTPFTIHQALHDARELPIALPLDVVSVTSETSLGHILETLPVGHKYNTIKVSACRVLRGGDGGIFAAKIPQWAKANLVDRVQNAPEVGELLRVGVRRQIFEKILQDHDQTKRRNSLASTLYERITTYQATRLFEKRDVNAEDDGQYVFFPLLGLYIEYSVALPLGAANASVVGYIAADGDDTQVFLSAELEVVIQPASWQI